ncbi:hypothetical protein THAOC_06739, partial [Thalassiosira oceanica]
AIASPLDFRLLTAEYNVLVIPGPCTSCLGSSNKPALESVEFSDLVGLVAFEAMSQASTLQSKRALYVGGVATAVKLDTLRAAFIPFGPINHIEMPMDYERGTHKGFAFIEFQDAGM